MSPADFLGAVSPEGLRILAIKVQVTDPSGRQFWTFRHSTARTADELVSNAWKTPKNLDLYYALASWKQGFHRDAKNKKVIRVRSNADMLKSFWFDIDFKDGYADEVEAIKALQSHCKETGIPAPSILVNSGNGLHAYWPLSEAIPAARWQVLADAFKEAAKKTGLRADLTCTADACRILRLPGTLNNKDPKNPKPVKIRYSSGKLFTAEEVESWLQPYLSTTSSLERPAYLAPVKGSSNEFTGTNSGTPHSQTPSAFSNIVNHCGFAKYLMSSRGAESSEPEWKDSLQLLRHCEDGELYIHEISDGHPDYTPEATKEKFAQRLANTAGPTLCSTLATYRPNICHKCPHWGRVKTPIHLGQVESKPEIGMPTMYRKAPKGGGIQKLMIDEEGNKEWTTILRYTIDGLKITRSVQDGSQESTFDWWAEGGVSRRMELPSAYFGNAPKMKEFMAENGMVLIRNEAAEFTTLMGTWIEQLQRNRRETKVTEQLGWIIEHDEKSGQEIVTGFSCGSKTYLRNGTEEGGVRVKKEYEAVSKHYEPRGSYDAWKTAANFITKQNYPGFTAVLATAFAAPLMRFTGEQGTILSLYSTQSGLGKSSIMKVAQSVWGSPIHGINSVNDTANSVIRKVGFINNLPCYWDELRGEGVMDAFCDLAFQITQGKEKSRLDSSAKLRTSVSWSTMVVSASNDSIFDSMGYKFKTSDAGMARVFEINILPVASDVPPAQISTMIDELQLNYGHAGREYARYITNNYQEVEETYKKWAEFCDKQYSRKAVERYWFSVMATLLTGATIARKAGIADFDISALAKFLGTVLHQLRARSAHTADSNSCMELVALYEQVHQDRILTVKSFPGHRENTVSYEADVVGLPPQSGKVIIWRSQADKAIRFSRSDFARWLLSRDINPSSVFAKLKRQHGAREMKGQLALGTRLVLPRMQIIEVPYEV